MLVSVLRNRLLDLTNHSFNTHDLGADSLIELVERHGDLIVIDRTVKPVVLVWVGPLPAVEPGTRARRVRPDLWQAALALPTEPPYEWDAAAGHARPVQVADPRRRLPAVDAATLATWRDAFVKEHEPTLSDPRDQERLRSWAATALGKKGLPGALRTQWNEYFKHQVVVHLTTWFHASGYEAPDMFGMPVEPVLDVGLERQNAAAADATAAYF
jgi:hypothetical protein